MARHAPGCLLKNIHDGPCVSNRPTLAAPFGRIPPAIAGVREEKEPEPAPRK